jgi:hypothetical protein
MACVELAKGFLNSGARIFLDYRQILGKIYDSEITGTEYELMTNVVSSDAELRVVGGYDVLSGFTIVNTHKGPYLMKGGKIFYIYQRCNTPASTSSYGQFPQFPLPSVTRGAPRASVTPSYEEVIDLQNQQLRQMDHHINELDLALFGQKFRQNVDPEESRRDWIEAGGDPAVWNSLGESSVGESSVGEGSVGEGSVSENLPVNIPGYIPNINANPPNPIQRPINMNRVAFPPQRPINRERGGRIKTKRKNKNKNKKKSLRRKLTKRRKA